MGEPTAGSLAAPHVSRYGIPGLAGGAVGGLLGGGPGYFIGGMAGGTAGEIMGRALRGNSGSPAAQARGINPVPKSLWDLTGENPLGRRTGKNPLERDRSPSRAARNSQQLPVKREMLESIVKRLREE